MSEEWPMGKREIVGQRLLDAAAGKTIKEIVPREMYGRIENLSLEFTDGTRLVIGYWTLHAEDAGLELKPTHPMPLVDMDDLS